MNGGYAWRELEITLGRLEETEKALGMLYEDCKLQAHRDERSAYFYCMTHCVDMDSDCHRAVPLDRLTVMDLLAYAHGTLDALRDAQFAMHGLVRLLQMFTPAQFEVWKTLTSEGMDARVAVRSATALMEGP